jgi:hypothetical protein
MEQQNKYVTLDWNGDPITTNGDGFILPRVAEMIINAQFYPNGTAGEWPCNPKTGEELEIEPNKFNINRQTFIHRKPVNN